MLLDLHMHSYYSVDGKGSLDRFIQNLHHVPIQFCSLTDHNTQAHHEALHKLTKAFPEIGGKLIYGIELSCQHSEFPTNEIHILAYWKNKEAPASFSGLNQLIENIQDTSQRRFDMLLENFDQRNDILSYWEKYKREILHPSIRRHPFILTLYNRSLTGSQFDHFRNKRKSLLNELILKNDGLSYPAPSEVIHTIKNAAGVSILAHPLRYNFEQAQLIALIEEFKNFGLEGLEVNDFEVQQYCERFELVATKGSDNHNLDNFGTLSHLNDLQEHFNPYAFLALLNANS